MIMSKDLGGGSYLSPNNYSKAHNVRERKRGSTMAQFPTLIKKNPEQDTEKDKAQTDPKQPDTTASGAAASNKATKQKSQDDSSKVEAMVKVAIDKGFFFHDKLKRPFVSMEVNDNLQTFHIRSDEFREYLRYLNYKINNNVAAKSTIETTIEHLAAICRYEGEQYSVSYRVAEHEGDIYIDLASKNHNAIRISRNGWAVVDKPPVKFVRSPAQLELPAPVKGGDLNELRRFLNITNEDSFRMLLYWIIYSFSPNGPYPILVLNGESGSGKSSMMGVAKALIDPSMASNRFLPASARDLFISAINSWVLDYDNLSGCPIWLSNALCMIATKGSFATRGIYTNDSEAIFPVMRPLIMGGIEDIAVRADFAERSIVLNFPQIDKKLRLDEETFWRDFNEKRPFLLGALCDAVSCALKNRELIKPMELPRMADFAKFILAAEPALPWPEGTFTQTYYENQLTTVDKVIEGDMVAVAVMSLMEHTPSLMASPSDILKRLEQQPCIDQQIIKSYAWPKASNKLREQLTRSAGLLREKGIEMNLDCRKGGLKKFIFTNRNVAPVAENVTITGTVDPSPQNPGDPETASQRGQNTAAGFTVQDILKKLNAIPHTEIANAPDKSVMRKLKAKDTNPYADLTYESVFDK